MTTKQKPIPPDFPAGWQHITLPEAMVRNGDIIAGAGPREWAEGLVGHAVGDCIGFRVYRKIPVPSQGRLPEATAIPSDAAQRKALPNVSGVLDYFPDALLAVAGASKAGNDQHSPGKPLHWDRSKSGDEADALGRHLLQRGTFDTDGVRHSAKVAWRALALLQKEIEASK